MNRSLIISSVLHGALIFITAMSLPFLAKKPLDIPPIVSVELIQIAEKTNIPFAPKAKKIIEKKKKKKLKEKEKKLVSEQAPPKKVKKTKTKTVVSLDEKKEKIDSQTPEAVPMPASTMTGTLILLTIASIACGFSIPLPDPIGAAKGITATQPASSKATA